MVAAADPGFSDAPQTSATYIRAALEAMEVLGLSRHQLLAAAGLAEAALDDEGGRVPLTRFRALTSEALRRSGNPALGLEVGLHMRMSAASPLFQAAISMPTLRHALALVVRYSPTIADGSSVETRGLPGGRLQVIQRFPRDVGAPDRIDVEITAVLAFRLMQALTGVKFNPLEVRFSFRRPAYAERCREVFQCPVRFGCDDSGLVLSAQQADLPTIGADPYIGRRMMLLLEERLNSLQSPSTYLDTVRLAVQRAIGPEVPRIGRVARDLHTSVRSLQRELARTGTSFSRLLDDAVRDAALAGLRAGRQSMEELAYQHGFASSAAFGRAVRRWTGLSPRAYRAGHTPPPPPA